MDDLELEIYRQTLIGKTIADVSRTHSENGDDYFRWTFTDGSYQEWHERLYRDKEE